MRFTIYYFLFSVFSVQLFCSHVLASSQETTYPLGSIFGENAYLVTPYVPLITASDLSEAETVSTHRKPKIRRKKKKFKRKHKKQKPEITIVNDEDTATVRITKKIRKHKKSKNGLLRRENVNAVDSEAVANTSVDNDTVKMLLFQQRKVPKAQSLANNQKQTKGKRKKQFKKKHRRFNNPQRTTQKNSGNGSTTKKIKRKFKKKIIKTTSNFRSSEEDVSDGSEKPSEKPRERKPLDIVVHIKMDD